MKHWNDLDFPLNQSPCEVVHFSMIASSGVTWHAICPPHATLFDVRWLCCWGSKRSGKIWQQLPFYMAYIDWMEARRETWLKINALLFNRVPESGKGMVRAATLKQLFSHMDLTLKIQRWESTKCIICLHLQWCHVHEPSWDQVIGKTYSPHLEYIFNFWCRRESNQWDELLINIDCLHFLGLKA